MLVIKQKFVLVKSFVFELLTHLIIKNKFLFPATGIILVALVLIIINEFTEFIINTRYAYMLIIAAVLFGFWFSKRVALDKK
ncbi:MAG: Uncharacterised protein [Formosa sp. Hel1_33_131]|nr:MAG: Uncharacterised protein [Formosa sp. Hel1_33_131]